MATSIVEDLRRVINTKHTDALRALDTIASYLEEPVARATNNAVATRKTKRKPPKAAPRAGTGKIRPKVLAALSGDFRPIKEVANETKLKPLQIRGVVLAPGLKDRFDKKEVDGIMHYKYQGETNDND